MVHRIVGGAIRAMFFLFTLVAFFAVMLTPAVASRIIDGNEKHDNVPVSEALFRKSAVQKNHGSWNEDPDADTDTDLEVDFNYTIPTDEFFDNFWDTYTPSVQHVNVTFGFDFAWEEGETTGVYDVPGTNGCSIFNGDEFKGKALEFVSRDLFPETTLRPLDQNLGNVTNVEEVHSTCLVTLQYESPSIDVKFWDAAFATIADEEDVSALREEFITHVMREVFEVSGNADGFTQFKNDLLAVRVVGVRGNLTDVQSISSTPSSSNTPSESYTPSFTASASETSSRTASASKTYTPSSTASASKTSSRTASASKTYTPSSTASASETSSSTASASETSSRTASETSSNTASQSESATFSASQTASATASLSEGSSASNTRSTTPSNSPSTSQSRSNSPSTSQSATNSPSTSQSATFTPSNTPSQSVTMTPSTSPCNEFDVNLYSTLGIGWLGTELKIYDCDGLELSSLTLCGPKSLQCPEELRGIDSYGTNGANVFDWHNSYDPKWGPGNDGYTDPVEICIPIRDTYRVEVSGGERHGIVAWDIRTRGGNAIEDVFAHGYGPGAPYSTYFYGERCNCSRDVLETFINDVSGADGSACDSWLNCVFGTYDGTVIGSGVDGCSSEACPCLSTLPFNNSELALDCFADPSAAESLLYSEWNRCQNTCNIVAVDMTTLPPLSLSDGSLLPLPWGPYPIYDENKEFDSWGYQVLNINDCYDNNLFQGFSSGFGTSTTRLGRENFPVFTTCLPTGEGGYKYNITDPWNYFTEGESTFSVSLYHNRSHKLIDSNTIYPEVHPLCIDLYQLFIDIGFFTLDEVREKCSSIRYFQWMPVNSIDEVCVSSSPSPSMTPTVSPSQTETPSQTASQSETPSFTASITASPSPIIQRAIIGQSLGGLTIPGKKKTVQDEVVLETLQRIHNYIMPSPFVHKRSKNTVKSLAVSTVTVRMPVSEMARGKLLTDEYGRNMETVLLQKNDEVVCVNQTAFDEQYPGFTTGILVGFATANNVDVSQVSIACIRFDGSAYAFDLEILVEETIDSANSDNSLTDQLLAAANGTSAADISAALSAALANSTGQNTTISVEVAPVTLTIVPSETPTTSPSPSITPSQTPSETSTASMTPSMTASMSPSITGVPDLSPSPTTVKDDPESAIEKTPSRTASVSASPSSSETASQSQTASSSVSETSSSSYSASETSSSSYSASETSSSSYSASVSLTPSASPVVDVIFATTKLCGTSSSEFNAAAQAAFVRAVANRTGVPFSDINITDIVDVPCAKSASGGIEIDFIVNTGHVGGVYNSSNVAASLEDDAAFASALDYEIQQASLPITITSVDVQDVSVVASDFTATSSPSPSPGPAGERSEKDDDSKTGLALSMSIGVVALLCVSMYLYLGNKESARPRHLPAPRSQIVAEEPLGHVPNKLWQEKLKREQSLAREAAAKVASQGGAGEEQGEVDDGDDGASTSTGEQRRFSFTPAEDEEHVGRFSFVPAEVVEAQGGASMGGSSRSVTLEGGETAEQQGEGEDIVDSSAMFEALAEEDEGGPSEQEAVEPVPEEPSLGQKLRMELRKRQSEATVLDRSRRQSEGEL